MFIVIKLKGITSAAKEVELSHEVKFITAQLKLSGGTNMLNMQSRWEAYPTRQSKRVGNV